MGTYLTQSKWCREHWPWNWSHKRRISLFRSYHNNCVDKW